MRKNNSYQNAGLSLLLASTVSSYAADYELNLRFGAEIQHLVTENQSAQPLPHFQTGETYVYSCNDGTATVNPAFYSAGNSVSLPANSIDAVKFYQLALGLKGIITPEYTLPNSDIVLGLSATAYGLYEGSEVAMQSDLYRITPLSTVGGDLGMLASFNGNILEIGGGAKVMRYEFNTGEVFSALGAAKENGTNPAVTTTDVFSNSADKEAFESEIDRILSPYVYAEIGTPFGDVATLYIRATQNFALKPEFHELNATPTSEMFPGGKAAYEGRYDWSNQSVMIGLQASLV